MITLNMKDKEVDITLKYTDPIGGTPSIELSGKGDLSHHLIEGVFGLVDRLARQEYVSHQSKEWRER